MSILVGHNQFCNVLLTLQIRTYVSSLKSSKKTENIDWKTTNSNLIRSDESTKEEIPLL